MAQAATLNKIGTRVKINLEKVRDRISVSLVEKLTEDPRGKVLGYKMTDGGGIGLVIELKDGTQSWFFDEEIGRS
tara:strand:+ start:92 stop:316 length:225 start_codon:yes stop_codon:yes gene_type:complete